MFLIQLLYKLLMFLFSMLSKKKMSCMYHRYGFSSILRKISSSKSAMNSILYGGANFVRITVPRFCFKVFSLKVKILFLRTTSASSTSVEVVTSFSYLKSSRLHRADKPSSFNIFFIIIIIMD